MFGCISVKGQIELSIVSIRVEIKIMPFNDVPKRCDVYNR